MKFELVTGTGQASIPAGITLDSSVTDQTLVANTAKAVPIKLKLAKGTVAGSYTVGLKITDKTTTANTVTIQMTVIISTTHNVVNDPSGALTADVDEVEQRRLLSALREVPTQRTIRGRQ